MDKLNKWLKSKPAKIAGLSLLTLLYLAGIICLFFNMQLGITLWGAALVPSIILFIIQKRNERLEKLTEAAQAAEAAQQKEAE